jgi:hypothetical protein
MSQVTDFIKFKEQKDSFFKDNPIVIANLKTIYSRRDKFFEYLFENYLQIQTYWTLVEPKIFNADGDKDNKITKKIQAILTGIVQSEIKAVDSEMIKQKIIHFKIEDQQTIGDYIKFRYQTIYYFIEMLCLLEKVTPEEVYVHGPYSYYYTEQYGITFRTDSLKTIRKIITPEENAILYRVLEFFKPSDFKFEDCKTHAKYPFFRDLFYLQDPRYVPFCNPGAAAGGKKSRRRQQKRSKLSLRRLSYRYRKTQNKKHTKK